MANRGKVAKLSTRKKQKPVKVTTQNKKTKLRRSGQESGSIYKKLVEASLQGIIIAQGIPPRLVYANPSISRMLGYTPDELTSLTIQQTQNLVHPDDRLSFFSRYKDRLEGKPVHPFYEIRAIRKDGSIGWFELSGTQIEYNGEPAVLATYVDITERKRAEEMVLENGALLDKSQAMAHVGSWELNLVANRLAWSDEVYRIFGLHPQEFGATYEAFLNTVHPDDRAAVDAAYSGSLRDGCDTYEIEHRIIRRNSGEVRVVHEKCKHVRDASGRVVRSVGIVQDITERKQAEEETKRLAQENAIMAEIGQIISSTLEIEEVYERFSEEVRKLIPFDRISINIVNPGNHTLTIAYAAGLEVPERSQGDIAPLPGTLTEKILTSKSGFFIQTEDRADVAKLFPKLLPSFDAGFRSMLSVPLISKDQAIGVLHFRSKKPNAYSEKDLSLAERVGNRISGAIANSLLFNEVKQTGKALRESEERYRTILDNIEDGYYEVDLSGNLTFFNDALCRILGYSREELIGMGNQQYTDETNRKKLFEAFNKVYRTGQPTKEFSWEVVRKDGTKRYGEVSISLTKDSEGKPAGFRGIARDVTDRKRAEEEIQHTLSLLNATLESTADGILVVDAEGKIKSFNQKFVQMWHIPESIIASGDDDQALTFVLSQLKYPEGFLSKVKELYSQPLAESFDLIEFKDGRVFERYSKAQQIGEQILGRVWSFRNITERKKAEEALKQSEERYRTLVEESFDGIFFQKGSDIIFANHSLHKMLGYEQGELEGRDHWIVYHPDYQVLTRERAHARMRGESAPSTYEVKFLRKDGSSFWGEINAKVINYLGEPGIQVWARDITEHKQAEKTLIESKERLGMILDGIDADIYIADIETHEILFMNKHMKDSFGDDLVGKVCWQAFRGDSKPCPHCTNPLLLDKEGNPAPVQVWEGKNPISNRYYLNYDRAIRWVDSRYVRLQVATDITERKQAEEALKESQERFKFLAEKMADVVWTLDINFRTTYVSPSIEKALGFTPEERKMQSLDQMVTPESFNRIQSLFLEELQREKSGGADPDRSIIVEVEYYRKDGSTVWMENTVKRMRDVTGSWVGIYGVSRDITERKQAEEALRLSEYQYRTTIDSMGDAIHVVNDELRIILANNTLKQWNNKLGLETEIFYKKVFEIYPFLTERVREEYQSVFKSGKVLVTEEQNKIGDQEVITETRKIPIFEGEKVHRIVTVIQDITSRKQSEEALHTEKKRFQSLSDQAPFGMMMIGKNGTFKYINPKFKELFGYDLTDVPDGRTWFEKVYPDPDYRHQVISAWKDDLTSSRVREKRSRVFKVRCKDGSEKIVNFISVISEEGENLVTCEDITDLKHSEQALRESEERYRMVIESSNDGVAIVRRDRHTYVNKQFAKMFGYESIEEVLGQSPYAWIHPDDREKVMEFNRKRQRGEDVPARYETKGIRKDGGAVNLDISATRILLHGESITLAYLRDITELKQAEEALQQAEEQLRQSQKMEAIGRLAGGIAHDFNNLLTVIKGYGELSLFGLQDEDPLKENINEICKASERAANLTRQLLAFSRKQILDFKVLNLNSLILDLDKMLHRILGEDIELIYKLDENVGRVKTDPGQIEQVILNLVVNARDAMPSGGKLVIQTDRAEEMDTPTLPSTIPGCYVRLSITDTGMGMTREVKEHLFEPFFTTKGKGKGTGLGLSTVYGIVKQSDGNIEVSSEPGQGTAFNIYLPRIEEEEDILQPEHDGISLLTGNETILLVEDEQSVRELATRVLSNRGYQLCPAPDGKEALKYIQDHPNQQIHLLLTDVVMPGMSGKELADHLKLSTPHTKVLFISGYTDDAIVHHGILDKGVNFVQKPFTPEALVRKVREVLDR